MRISTRRSSVVVYYGYDLCGSVMQLCDSTGAITDTYTYDAFGNTVAQTGATVNSFLYRSEQFDSTLGMYYLRARLYRVQLGRFLTQDGGFGNLQEPLSLHKYLYASADPAIRVHPSTRATFFVKP